MKEWAWNSGGPLGRLPFLVCMGKLSVNSFVLGEKGMIVSYVYLFLLLGMFFGVFKERRRRMMMHVFHFLLLGLLFGVF